MPEKCCNMWRIPGQFRNSKGGQPAAFAVPGVKTGTGCSKKKTACPPFRPLSVSALFMSPLIAATVKNPPLPYGALLIANLLSWCHGADATGRFRFPYANTGMTGFLRSSAPTCLQFFYGCHLSHLLSTLSRSRYVATVNRHTLLTLINKDKCVYEVFSASPKIGVSTFTEFIPAKTAEIISIVLKAQKKQLTY